jgi:hypothetical protein
MLNVLATVAQSMPKASGKSTDRAGNRQYYYVVRYKCRGGDQMPSTIQYAVLPMWTCMPETFQMKEGWKMVADHMARGRRPDIDLGLPVVPGFFDTCRCQDVSCGHPILPQGHCTRDQRFATRLCSTCAPKYGLGCEYCWWAPTKCPKGIQQSNCIGMRLCQRHSHDNLGVLMGGTLKDVLSSTSGPQLLCSVVTYKANKPNSVVVKGRYRGSNNGMYVLVDALTESNILKLVHKAFGSSVNFSDSTSQLRLVSE